MQPIDFRSATEAVRHEIVEHLASLLPGLGVHEPHTAVEFPRWAWEFEAGIPVRMTVGALGLAEAAAESVTRALYEAAQAKGFAVERPEILPYSEDPARGFCGTVSFYLSRAERLDWEEQDRPDSPEESGTAFDTYI